MRDQNAERLLTAVMGWRDQETVLRYVPVLQLLSDYKYDGYQRFAPGRRFIESLALWLNQFESSHRQAALDFVVERVIFISDSEFSHLVETAYPDVILPERIRLVAEELGISSHLVGTISKHPRFEELRLKSLYLGLSDGARTNELRRSSSGEISNEQIWQAYELGHEKADDMRSELVRSLATPQSSGSSARFTVAWLLDDFSGSGNTYIRFDRDTGRFKGKLAKIYPLLHDVQLIDTLHYEIFLLLYTATRQAVDHIEYWSERFAAAHGYKPLQLRVLNVLERDIAVSPDNASRMHDLITSSKYYDERASDKHIAVGGTSDAKYGFAGCALPVVLSHNTPNNSIYLLWGPESFNVHGLFPRVSRHREF
jgi:hypothetical protein